MSEHNSIEDFCLASERISEELSNLIKIKDIDLIQQKIAELNSLLHYNSNFDEIKLDSQVKIIAGCFERLLALLSEATDLLVADQNKISAQLTNIQRSKRISSYYQKSNNNEP